MRKLILYTAVSLDGYVARTDGDLDWLPQDKNEDYGFSAFEEGIDEAVMGFNTYDKVSGFPGNPFERMPHYVMTTKAEVPDDKRVTFVQQELSTFLGSLLTKKTRKDVWLMGGGQLIRSVLSAGINIDEWMLFFVPVVLGEGIPLFPPSFPSKKLILKQSINYKNGMVLLHYESEK